MGQPTRHIAVVLVLLGQLFLSVQAFAAGSCHAQMSDSPAHAMTSGHAAHEEATTEGAAAACACAPGMHCGHVAILLPDVLAKSDRVRLPTEYPSQASPQTLFAHSRNPDKPPSCNV